MGVGVGVRDSVRISARVMVRVIRARVRIRVRVGVRVGSPLFVLRPRVKKGRQSLHPRSVLKDHLWGEKEYQDKG